MWKASSDLMPALPMLPMLLTLALAGGAVASRASAQDRTSEMAALRLELESRDGPRVEAARKKVMVMRPAGRVAFLRYGLGSKDTATAAWCAGKLQHNQVDLREAERVIDLLIPVVAREKYEDNEPDFDEFRQLIGSSELPKLFAAWPENPDWIGHGTIMGGIHRQVRPEHVPALCRLAQSKNRRQRDAVLDSLLTAILPHTDQHREAVGLALLFHRKVKLSDEERRQSRRGYPPVLFRCLQEMDRFVTRRRSWAVQNYLWRWAREEQAGPADGELLLKLLVADNMYSQSIAVHGLGDFVDARTRRGLAKFCAELEKKLATQPSRDARGLLIALGGTWARRLERINADRVQERRVAQGGRTILERHADRSSLALGLLLEHQRRAGRALFKSLLFDANPDRRSVALDLLTDDEGKQLLGGLRLQERAVRQGWFAGLHKEIPKTDSAGRPLTGLQLTRIVMRVPGCRRADLAVRAAAQADVRKPDPETHLWRDHEVLGLLAFLEVTRPQKLKALLHSWAASGNKKLVHASRELQLRLGDETAVDELVTWMQQQGGNLDADAWHQLPRTRSPKALAFLEKMVRDKEAKDFAHKIHGLAIYHGLPEQVRWHEDLAEAEDAVVDAVRKLVLAGKPVDGLVRLLDSLNESQGYEVGNLGLVRDDRVVLYLEKVRGMRHLGLYSWATSQLGICGKSKAREEFWRGCRIGRYRWLDEANVLARTLGGDRETVPFWISELATNCCRRNAANSVFEELFGVDLHVNQNGLPEIVRARRLWQRHGKNLRHSRIAGHLVPGPD